MKNLRYEKLSKINRKSKPEDKVDYLDPTEDGEASEKTHSASYQTQLGFYCHL